jgi:hypothetical protein
VLNCSNEKLFEAYSSVIKQQEIHFAAPLPFNTTIELIQILMVDSGDTFWEIGCGGLQLASTFSCASLEGIVIATDLGMVTLI